MTKKKKTTSNKKKTLTIKQELFIQEYMKDGDASMAYRKAYDCSMMKTTSINSNAHKLINHTEIALRIAALRAKIEKSHEVTRDKVLKELAHLAFVDTTKLFDLTGQLKPIHEIDEATRRAIASVEISSIKVEENITTTTYKIKLWDKKGALEVISRMQGYNAPEHHKTDVTLTDETGKTKEEIKKEVIANLKKNGYPVSILEK